jgi:hypothetical protein
VVRLNVRQCCLYDARYSPRASLPGRWRYLLPEQRRSTVSAGITRPSSLLSAHAPDQTPPADFGVPRSTGPCRLLRAPAGGWPFPTLSLRSLHRRLGPYPATPERCVCPLLPARHRPPLRVKRIGSRNIPQHSFPRGEISGLQPFSHVQAPMLAWPSGCSDRQGTESLRPPGRPYTPGSTRALAGRRLRHRYVSESGQLTRQDLCGHSPPLTCWIAVLSAAPDPESP